jgi:hypothetical protein
VTIERQRPPGGGEWLDNAGTYEDHRVSCLQRAERQRTELGAEKWLARAEHWRELRDRAHAEGKRREVNRSVHRRR